MLFPFSSSQPSRSFAPSPLSLFLPLSPLGGKVALSLFSRRLPRRLSRRLFLLIPIFGGLLVLLLLVRISPFFVFFPASIPSPPPLSFFLAFSLFIAQVYCSVLPPELRPAFPKRTNRTRASLSDRITESNDDSTQNRLTAAEISCFQSFYFCFYFCFVFSLFFFCFYFLHPLLSIGIILPFSFFVLLELPQKLLPTSPENNNTRTALQSLERPSRDLLDLALPLVTTSFL